MDLFLKILLTLFGGFFIFLGVSFLVRSKKIIQAIQKYRYKMTAEPRPQEILLARIMGILLLIFGLYYFVVGALSIFA